MFAFSNRKDLESISIPNSIINIKHNVFDDCKKLKYNEYNNWKYLGNSDNLYLLFIKPIDKEVSTFEINESTKIIMDDAFFNCSSLTSNP